MCKKLLVAAVAIVVGLTVVKHTRFGSLLEVWWKDARTSVERQIPPEVMVRQLSLEIDKIDRDIKKNLSRLAAQEVECQMLAERVDALEGSQKQLQDEISGMAKVADAKTTRVAFNGTTYHTPELVRKLDSAVTRYEARKAELKAKRQLMADKKRTLEAAHERIDAMRNQKEQLRTTVARLETRIETLKLKQMEAKVELDDSQVGKCNDLAGKLEERLRKSEMEAKLQAEFGYRAIAPAAEHDRTPEEVLKAARKALEDDGEAVSKK